MNISKVRHIISLITCFLLLLAVAVNKEQKILGTPLNHPQSTTDATTPTEQQENSGVRIISTEQLAKDIFGYAGNVPLEIHMKDNRIIKVILLKNSETPAFFKSVTNSKLLSNWDNLTPDEALNKKADAISGATLSSNAIISSVHRAMNYVKETPQSTRSFTELLKPDFKLICIILVVLSALIIPYITKSPKMRMAQLVLNVIVLGLWSGSFISLSLLTNYVANGLNIWTSVVPLLLLLSAFIMPLLGKKSHYCTWVCPMGALQEVLSKTVPYKYRLKTRLINYLNYFREGLWFLIMLLMWLGVGFEIMDYEIFPAFLFQQATTPVLILACVFLLLSCVIHRPYCRFVCPTGTLLKFSQQTK